MCTCIGACRITPNGEVKRQWWDKEPGYVKQEVKAALRRKADEVPHWLQKARLPTLAASSKRLAGAQLTLNEGRSVESQYWEGPKAAEQYVAYRRKQLGLDGAEAETQTAA